MASSVAVESRSKDRKREEDRDRYLPRREGRLAGRMKATSSLLPPKSCSFFASVVVRLIYFTFLVRLNMFRRTMRPVTILINILRL